MLRRSTAATCTPLCPGVYAIDNELYRALVHPPPAERKHAIEEAERRRQLGQPYTLEEYRHDSRNPQP